MVWFKTDDGLPEHPKTDALAEHCGDDWALLSLAVMTWLHLGCDSAARETDGRVSRSRAHRVVRAPKKHVDRALAALVAVGFLDEISADEWCFHKWTKYQPTKAELEVGREKNAARQADWRSRKHGDNAVARRESNAVTNAVTDPSVTGAPSRPVPARTREELSPPPAEARTDAPLPPAPAAQTAAPVLTLEPPTAKAAKAREPKADGPPPFSDVTALTALADASRGRFVLGVENQWDGGHRIAVRKQIRKFPSLALWTLVGEWLAAGGEGYQGPLTLDWAAKKRFGAVVTLAQAWAQSGRPVVDAKYAVTAPRPGPIATTPRPAPFMVVRPTGTTDATTTTHERPSR